jgi:hypothetical protein
MKTRLTIFVLSTFLLWTSLLIPVNKGSYSKQSEIKVAAEFICKAIVHEEEFAWKKSSLDLLPNFLASSWTNPCASAGRLKSLTYFAASSVKYYLLFRVLRN